MKIALATIAVVAAKAQDLDLGLDDTAGDVDTGFGGFDQSSDDLDLGLDDADGLGTGLGDGTEDGLVDDTGLGLDDGTNGGLVDDGLGLDDGTEGGLIDDTGLGEDVQSVDDSFGGFDDTLTDDTFTDDTFTDTSDGSIPPVDDTASIPPNGSAPPIPNGSAPPVPNGSAPPVPNGSAPPLPPPVIEPGKPPVKPPVQKPPVQKPPVHQPPVHKGYVDYSHIGGHFDDHGYAFPPQGVWNEEHQFFDFGQQYDNHHIQPSIELGFQPKEQFVWVEPVHDWFHQDQKTYQHCNNYMADMGKWKFDKYVELHEIDIEFKVDWDFHWGQIHYCSHYMVPNHEQVWHLHHAIQKFKAWYHQAWAQFPQHIAHVDILCDEAWGSFTGIYNHFVSWPIYETMQGWYHTARPNGLTYCEDVWQTSFQYYSQGPQVAFEHANTLWDDKYAGNQEYESEYGAFFSEIQSEFPLAAQQEAAPAEDTDATDDTTGSTDATVEPASEEDVETFNASAEMKVSVVTLGLTMALAVFF